MSVDEALQNGPFLLKIHRKVKQSLMQRGENGIARIQESLYNMDVPREGRVELWEFCEILRDDGGIRLSALEAEVLFRLHDHGNTGALVMDEFLAEVRGKLCCTNQQLEDIFRQIRQRSKHHDMGLPELFPCVDFSRSVRNARLTAAQFNKCLYRNSRYLDITPSDIVFLFVHLQRDGTIGVDDLAKRILHRLSPTPSEAMNQILLKLRDSVEDPDRTHSGGIGLRTVFNKIGGATQKPNGVQLFDYRRFLFGMANFGTGLRTSEVSTLFDALQKNNLINILTVTNILQQNPPPVSREEAAALTAKLRRELRASTYRLDSQPNILPAVRILANECSRELAEALTKNGFSNNVLERGFIDVFRLGGLLRTMLPATHVPDIEIEVLFSHLSSDVRRKKLQTRRRKGQVEPSLAVEDDDDDDFAYADRCVEVAEFVENLRGEQDPLYAELVGAAWAQARGAAGGSDAASFDDYLRAFNPANTPLVRCGAESPFDVVQEMQKYFEAHVRRQRAAASGPFGNPDCGGADDFTIDEALFRDYWADVACTMGGAPLPQGGGADDESEGGFCVPEGCGFADDLFVHTVGLGFSLGDVSSLMPVRAPHRGGGRSSTPTQEAAPQQQQPRRSTGSLPRTTPHRSPASAVHADPMGSAELWQDRPSTPPPLPPQSSSSASAFSTSPDAAPAAGPQAVAASVRRSPTRSPVRNKSGRKILSEQGMCVSFFLCPVMTPQRGHAPPTTAGGGRVTLNIFGGDASEGEEPTRRNRDPSPVNRVSPPRPSVSASVPRRAQPVESFTGMRHAANTRVFPPHDRLAGSKRAGTAASIRQLHTERPF